MAVQTVLPPIIAAPAPGASVALGDAFLVSGPGTYEHSFTPQGTGSGPTIHVLTANGEAHLPSFAGNATQPHGAYTWTVRAFPNAALSGRDARRAKPSATSAPRTIVFP